MRKSVVTKIREAFCAGCWTSSMNHTYEKASQVSTSFWFLLIKSGFDFTKTDLVDNDVWCSEGHYSLAVRCGNLSFAYSYEHRHKRTPFIGTGLDYDSCYPSFSNHATQSKSAGRLVMGTEFTWKDFKVKVTSFNDKKLSLVACAYHKRKGPDDYSDKIKKRFTITAEDFRKEMSIRKKLEKRDSVLKEKGVKIGYSQGNGYYISKEKKGKFSYYDTTGKVDAGMKFEKYKLFKTYEAVIEFAETL